MHVKKNTDKLLFSDQLQMQIPDPLLLQWIKRPGTLYRDNHAHLFLSKEAILNEVLKMFISYETKAAIGQGQRSCSDFPCSIHFHCILIREHLVNDG